MFKHISTCVHVIWSHELFYRWNSKCVLCASQTQENVKHQMHEYGNINEYMPNLLTMGVFWRCNKKQNRDWRFKWRQKVSYIVRLYNNTRIMTLLKWINWYCIDKTGDGQMQISCGTIWNYSSTVTLFFPFFFAQETHM